MDVDQQAEHGVLHHLMMVLRSATIESTGTTNSSTTTSRRSTTSGVVVSWGDDHDTTMTRTLPGITPPSPSPLRRQTQLSYRQSWRCLASLVFVVGLHLAVAFPVFPRCSSHRTPSIRLLYQDSPDNNDSTNAGEDDEAPADAPSKDPSRTSMERLSVSGVSVSSEPPGFFLLLETGTGTLPLQVTCDPQDAFATTSPQALTVIQLLSGVDMAGPILPPETLAKLLVLSCESIPEPFLDEPQQQVLELVQTSLARARATTTNLDESTTPLLFSDSHPWLQSRCQLPQVTLDELILTYAGDDTRTDDNDEGCATTTTTTTTKTVLSNPARWNCQLQCNVKWIGSLSVTVTSDLIQAVSYQYHDSTSTLFTCLALALRYKAPMSLRLVGNCDISLVSTEEDLEQLFPKRTTVAKLQQSSTRVTKNIERGFEIHKLQKALEIARKRGDTLAEAKIRAALDEMDSFQELPVTTQHEKEVGNSKADEVDGSSFQ